MNELFSPIGDGADEHRDPAPSTRALWFACVVYLVLMVGVIALAKVAVSAAAS